MCVLPRRCPSSSARPLCVLPAVRALLLVRPPHLIAGGVRRQESISIIRPRGLVQQCHPGMKNSRALQLKSSTRAGCPTWVRWAPLPCSLTPSPRMQVAQQERVLGLLPALGRLHAPAARHCRILCLGWCFSSSICEAEPASDHAGVFPACARRRRAARRYRCAPRDRGGH